MALEVRTVPVSHKHDLMVEDPDRPGNKRRHVSVELTKVVTLKELKSYLEFHSFEELVRDVNEQLGG